MTSCPFCLPGQITWNAAWREWHGRCDNCGQRFYAPDARCANRDRAVRLAPSGTECVRMEVAGIDCTRVPW